MYMLYIDLASIKNKKEYDLIQMWGLKVEGLLMIKSIEKIVFILMAQDNVSLRELLWINGWDRNASFKRLRKMWVQEALVNKCISVYDSAELPDSPVLWSVTIRPPTLNADSAATVDVVTGNTSRAI